MAATELILNQTISGFVFAMDKMAYIILFGCFLPGLLQAVDIEDLIEKIYERILIQEKYPEKLGDYSHIQKIHFTKYDRDGEIEEQSIREFEVKIRSSEKHYRKLISGHDFENGEWIDVTLKENNKTLKAQTRSQEFSLTEIVGPEERRHYKFILSGDDVIRNIPVLQIYAEPTEADDEKFKGNLWFDKTDYSLIQAELIPSEFPTGVDNMKMIFQMDRFGTAVLPVKIDFEADISFLIIFKGRIKSEILFEDYKFNQSFPDSLFLHEATDRIRKR